MTGVRLAFEPGSDRTAVPVRSAVLGTALALAAVIAALVFGASLAHVIGDPRLAGWNWDVAVGNPHSGDTSAQTIPRLRANASLAGFTATALGDGDIGGQDVPVVGIQTLRGHVAPPLLDGRLPSGPREIALSGGELRALHRQRRRAGPRPDRPGEWSRSASPGRSCYPRRSPTSRSSSAPAGS